MKSDENKGNGRFPLIILTLAKFVMDVSSRLIFPFLPEFSRGLGVSLEQLQRLIGLRSGVAMLGSFAVPLSERFGRKPFLLGSYLIFVVGSGVIFLFPSYWVFGGVLIATAFAKVLFGANVHAIIADVVPYAQRGRSTALLEMSWGLALLLGAPAAGWLIARFGWQSPFAFLAVLGLLVMVILWQYVPETHEGTNKSGAKREPFWRTIRAHPSIISASIFVVFNMWGNQLLFISYADWMEQKFSLTLGALGLSAVVIGLSELIGEGAVGGFSDRIGKKRFVIWTGILAAVCYALIPLVSSSRELALVALFATFFTFEMSVVGALPIYTEIAPKARTIALAATGLASLLGRTIGSFMAPELSKVGGFQLISFVAAGVTLLGILVLWLGVRDVGD